MSVIAAGCLHNNNCAQSNNGAIKDSNIFPPVFYKKGIGVNVTEKLTLNDDSTYVEHTRAVSDVNLSMATSTVSGKYKLYQNKLLLTPQKLLSYDYQGNYIKLGGTDTIIKQMYHYVSEYKIIKYKDLVLLLDDSTYSGSGYSNDFIDIANSINEHDGEADIDYYYKNSENSSITVDKDILNSFSSPWYEYILDEPVKGKVINIKKTSSEDKVLYKYMDTYSEYIFTLDIGTMNGIRNGMKLFSIGKDSCSCELTILKTDKNQCKGYIRGFQEKNCLTNTDFNTKRY